MANALVEPAAVVERTLPDVNPWRAAWTLARREWVRFIRQGNRVFGALGQPILFWLLLGALMGPSFHMGGGNAPGISYIEYYFPGAVVMILLFTAIFATISIIEDRREGFLQSVLVAPIPRWSMVLGKILGGTLIAVAQGGLFVLLGYTLGLTLGPVVLLAVVGWIFLVALALTALGFTLAWRMESTQGFHAVMMVFLFPMWLLSGAFAPPGPGVVGWVIRLNPLTYAVAGLRRLLYWDMPVTKLPDDLPSAGLCGVVTLVFCLVMFAAAWKIASARTTGDML